MSDDLSGWIETHAGFTPDKVALKHARGEETYAGFADKVRTYARMLKHRLGVGRGDRIAYLGPNTAEYLFLFFAAARLGAMFLPLNWRLAAAEHAYILRDSGAKAVFCDDEYLDHAEGFRIDFPDTAFVGCRAAASRFGWHLLEEELSLAAGDDHNPHVGPDAPFLLVYTSGTTGRPKGAVLTQEAIHYNALNCVHAADMRSGDKILVSIPLFHVGGLNIMLTPGLYCGASIVLHERFDPGDALRSIEDDRITLIIAVPAVMQALKGHPGWESADLSSLRQMTTGSTIVPVAMIQPFLDRGMAVCQLYGSTETAPGAIYQLAADGYRKPGSIGKPALHCEARIVDADGADVAPGESGEILIKGKSILYEYWGNEEATREAIRDGWYHTGDVGYRDEDGDYWVNDRLKDVIISGGENIYPAEVEQVLYDMDEVEDASVVGRPDEKWGEVPVAVIALRDGAALDKETVAGRLDGVLARFKHPKDVVFVDEFPRNAMGKILKYELRGLVAGG